MDGFRLGDKVKCSISKEAFYLSRGFKPKQNRMQNYVLIGTQTVGPLKASVYSGRALELWVGKLKGIPVEIEDLILAYHEVRPISGLLLKGITHNAERPTRQDTSVFSIDKSGTKSDR